MVYYRERIEIQVTQEGLERADYMGPIARRAEAGLSLWKWTCCQGM